MKRKLEAINESWLHQHADRTMWQPPKYTTEGFIQFGVVQGYNWAGRPDPDAWFSVERTHDSLHTTIHPTHAEAHDHTLTQWKDCTGTDFPPVTINRAFFSPPQITTDTPHILQPLHEGQEVAIWYNQQTYYLHICSIDTMRPYTALRQRIKATLTQLVREGEIMYAIINSDAVWVYDSIGRIENAEDRLEGIEGRFEYCGRDGIDMVGWQIPEDMEEAALHKRYYKTTSFLQRIIHTSDSTATVQVDDAHKSTSKSDQACVN
jgi:hypothetical protein